MKQIILYMGTACHAQAQARLAVRGYYLHDRHLARGESCPETIRPRRIWSFWAARGKMLFCVEKRNISAGGQE